MAEGDGGYSHFPFGRSLDMDSNLLVLGVSNSNLVSMVEKWANLLKKR